MLFPSSVTTKQFSVRGEFTKHHGLLFLATPTYSNPVPATPPPNIPRPAHNVPVLSGVTIMAFQRYYKSHDMPNQIECGATLNVQHDLVNAEALAES